MTNTKSEEKQTNNEDAQIFIQFIIKYLKKKVLFDLTNISYS